MFFFKTLGSQNSGAGAWGESKDKPDTGGPGTWNVDIFVQVVKDLVSVVLLL